MSELKIYLLIVRKNLVYSGEIYTDNKKKFTLPLAVTALTNSTSVRGVDTNHAREM